MAHESTDDIPQPRQWGLVAVTWTLVAIPLTWGVWMTIKKAIQLFSH